MELKIKSWENEDLCEADPYSPDSTNSYVIGFGLGFTESESTDNEEIAREKFGLDNSPPLGLNPGERQRTAPTVAPMVAAFLYSALTCCFCVTGVCNTSINVTLFFRKSSSHH